MTWQDRAYSRPKQTWQAKVRNVYSSLAELRAYNRVYGVARRCGFRSAVALWRANPRIGGSTNPAAFGLARRMRKVAKNVTA